MSAMVISGGEMYGGDKCPPITKHDARCRRRPPAACFDGLHVLNANAMLTPPLPTLLLLLLRHPAAVSVAPAL